MVSSTRFRSLLLCLFLAPLLAACTPTDLAGSPPPSPSPPACPVSEAQWLLPPDDPAVGNAPAHGYYYANSDRSIWAAAWWWGEEAEYLRAGGNGIKTGFFRPAGVELAISGRRLDDGGESAPFEAIVPCCYPTRFQATGLIFPTAGCWEVTATAGESELAFVVEIRE